VIQRSGIEQTYSLIQPHIRVTPVVHLSGADLGLAPFPLTLKLESLQHAGSFKTRGAFANLLTRAIPAAGVVAASGGNHGAAVAYAAMRLGVRARIFVPTVSSPAKIARIRHYGAELVVGGERYADALAASLAWIAESGALPVHAFDQEQTLLGQGTLALEMG
jgi:threonine dehydratase